MRTSQFVAAMALSASAAEAAPRGSAFRQWYEKTIAGRLSVENQNVVEHEQRAPAGHLHHQVFQRRMAQNDTGNATTVTLTTTMTQRQTTTLEKLAGPTAAAAVAQLPVDVCPTGRLIISTTTIDVTVYASATEAPTAGALPVENKAKAVVQDTVTVGLPSSSTTAQAAVVPQSAPSSSASGNGIVATVQSSSSSTPILSSTSTSTSVTTPVSVNQGPMINAAPIVNTPSSSETAVPTIAIPTPPNTTPSASPSSTEIPISITTPLLIPSSSSSSSTSSSPPAPTRTIATIPIQVVIDPNMRPVTTSALPSTPAAPAPTKTLCEHDEMAGAPEKQAQYCGVTGRPAGVYFLAEFIEERSTVPVTEEGCFQFCGSVMESTKGCQSYRFYHNHLGAPRCALYGMPVSWSIEDLDAGVGDKWFDLGCGSPSVEAWHSTASAGAPSAATSTLS